MKSLPKLDQKFSKVSHLSAEYRNSLGRLIKLTDAQRETLKKKLKRELTDWKDSRSGLERRLRKINDTIEGVVDETTYPFEGASNVHVPLALIYLKVYHSITRRSLLSTDSIWYSETEDDELMDFLPDIDDAMNYNARNKWNISEAISDVLWITPRDGLGALKISYVEDIKKNVRDVIYVSSIEDFDKEFPVEDETMSISQRQMWIEKVQAEATVENPVEIPIVYDKEIYKGPKAEVVELVDLVTFPATCKDISSDVCRGYGNRFYMRRGEIRKKIKDGVWYKDVTEEFLKNARQGSQVSNYMTSKDRIEGLNRAGKSDDYELFEVVYRWEIEKGKGEEEFLVTYSLEKDELLSCVQYPYRVDFFALFRIHRNPNRLVGRSIISEIEDIGESVDALHNQRINSRKIAEVPSFKGKKERKKDFDSEAEENQWKPGVIFWLEDPDSFIQFTVQPVNLESSMHEEQNYIFITGLITGVKPDLFSGSPATEDKDAPGNKTAFLIQQSNMRMDDPLSELRYGIEKVGEICLSHMYQFGPAQITYIRSNALGKKESGVIQKRILRKGVTIKTSGVTVTLNPETEFMRWFNYYKLMSQDPIIGQRVKSRWFMLMNALRAGRVQGKEKILPTLEELEQEEIEMRAKVEKQLQFEQMQQLIQEAGEKKKEVINSAIKQKKLQKIMTGGNNGSRQAI